MGRVASWLAEGMVFSFEFQKLRALRLFSPTSVNVDLKIQLFDFQQEDLSRPSWSFVGPMVRAPLCAHVFRWFWGSGADERGLCGLKSNVFSLAFSANNTHLYWYICIRSSTVFAYEGPFSAAQQGGSYTSMIWLRSGRFRSSRCRLSKCSTTTKIRSGMLVVIRPRASWP